MLAEVFVDGEQTEHHYWNRLEGDDIDLTREQFTNGEDVREKTELPNEVVLEKVPTMRPELQQRVKLLRESVSVRLGN